MAKNAFENDFYKILSNAYYGKTKNEEQLTKLFCKSDVIQLADVFEKYIKVSINKSDSDPLYCVSLPGYISQCGLKNTDIKLEAH